MGAIRDMLENLGDMWLAKCMIGLSLTIIASTHFNLLLCFIALVFLDLLSKQLSLAAKFVADTNKIPITKVDTWSKIISIPVAIQNGYIQSFYMRKAFLRKMATYFFAVVSAGLCDTMIMSIDEPFLLNLVYGYLGATELLSIFENLKDGGNKQIAKLLDVIKDKLDARVNKNK